MNTRVRHLIAGMALFAGVFAAAADGKLAAYDPTAAGASPRGASLTLIVPVSKGQGFDQYARLLAPYLTNRLKTPVVVVNRPGRAMAAGLEAVLNAPADGRTIGLLSGSQILLSALAEKGKVDERLGRMGIIARVNAAPLILLVNVSHAVSDMADLQSLKRPLNLGGGVGNPRRQLEAALNCRAARIRCIFQGRFATRRAQVLSAIRGRLDAVLIRERSARRITRRNMLRPIAVAGVERAALYPRLPALVPPGQDSGNSWWRELAFEVRGLGRLVVAPPGVRKNQLSALRSVFRDVLTSPRFIAAAGRESRGVAYAPPGPIQEILRRRLNDPTSREAGRVLARMVDIPPG